MSICVFSYLQTWYINELPALLIDYVYVSCLRHILVFVWVCECVYGRGLIKYLFYICVQQHPITQTNTALILVRTKRPMENQFWSPSQATEKTVTKHNTHINTHVHKQHHKRPQEQPLVGLIHSFGRRRIDRSTFLLLWCFCFCTMQYGLVLCLLAAVAVGVMAEDSIGPKVTDEVSFLPHINHVPGSSLTSGLCFAWIYASTKHILA